MIAHTLLRCPAPNILNASPFWLITLHKDNILRVWNTNDGRCVVESHKSMLKSNGEGLMKIKGYIGHILVIGDKGDIYVVNILDMTLRSHFMPEHRGFACCRYDP